MDDGKLSVAVSDHRREFIDEELAAGTYASEAEIIDAALELLENKKKLDAPHALIAEGDADIAAGRVHLFDSADDLTVYIKANSESLRGELAKAAASGESNRRLPDIMNAVKTRLRANGALLAFRRRRREDRIHL